MVPTSELVSFPGAYAADHPGIFLDIWNRTYTPTYLPTYLIRTSLFYFVTGELTMVVD